MKDDKQENKWFPGVVIGDKVYAAQIKPLEISLLATQSHLPEIQDAIEGSIQKAMDTSDLILKSELEQARKEIAELKAQVSELEMLIDTSPSSLRNINYKQSREIAELKEDIGELQKRVELQRETWERAVEVQMMHVISRIPNELSKSQYDQIRQTPLAEYQP